MFENDKYDKKCLDELSVEWLKGQSFKKGEISDSGSNLCIHYGELFTKYGPVIKDVHSKTDADVKRTSKKGDILFPASDVTPNGLARCSALLQEGILLGGDIIVMRPSMENNSVYLSYAINYQKMQLLSRVTGAVVKHISAKSLKSVIVPVPSIELQNKFVMMAEQSDKSKFELERALAELKTTYKKIISENLS
jgi:type I restriction enzyme, S subunit